MRENYRCRQCGRRFDDLDTATEHYNREHDPTAAMFERVEVAP